MKKLLILLFVFLLSSCGGGGGSGNTTSSTATTSSLVQTMTYQNADQVAQVFNTQVADLNGDGLDDVVVSGWAVEPPGYTTVPHGKIPLKILIQQTDGTLKDETDQLLGVGNNMIYGSQRIIIADFDGNGKPDIFLGGFEDSPSMGSPNCCVPVPSVMFWNEGTSFTRYDFPDTVWAHAACADDLYSNGRIDIVMGGTGTYPSNVYVNNGNRSFTLIHLPQAAYISAGGSCAVVHDPTTGNVGIVTTNLVTVVPNYTAVIQEFDHSMNYLTSIGLPSTTGSSGSHDIVNTIPIDLNHDGLTDLVLTDSHTGNLIALINQGNLVFADQSSTYFASASTVSGYPFVFGYGFSTETLNINGNLALFIEVSTSGSNISFSALNDLWIQNGSSGFVPYLQSQLNSDIGTYQTPTLYKNSQGGYSLLLLQQTGTGYTFYTKPM